VARGGRPPPRLALDEDRGDRQPADPFSDLVGVVALQARRQQEALDLLGVDEPADLTAVLRGLVGRAAQLDADAEGGGRGPRAGDDRWPVEVQRGDDHADGEAGRGRPGLGGGLTVGGQRRPAVDLGHQAALGQGGDVATDGQLADAELAREVTDPYGTAPSQLGKQSLLPLRAEQPL
jgi:hypothetical protein